MTQNDVDRRLREHGAAWREVNHERPGVDWEAVTAPPRSKVWIAVVGVSVTAAAIVVPLVLTAGSHQSSAPPTVSPSPTAPPSPKVHRSSRPSPPPSSALVGAPPDFAAIHNGSVTFVQPRHATEGVRPSGKTAAASAVSADGRTAYGAYAESGCRTLIERVGHSKSPQGVPDLVTSDVATIDARQPHGYPSPLGAMALSPDGTKLAVLITGGCGSSVSTGIAVLDLATHQVREWTLSSYRVVEQLAWSPDSRRLAYSLDVPCALPREVRDLLPSGSVFRRACPAKLPPPPGPPVPGTFVLDTAAPGQTLAAGRSVFDAGGPVFWWHGRLVTTSDGLLWTLGKQVRLPTYGKVVATGLPRGIYSVSNDPSGDHLLIAVRGGKTYRWDNGYLTLVPGDWTQPGW